MSAPLDVIGDRGDHGEATQEVKAENHACPHDSASIGRPHLRENQLWPRASLVSTFPPMFLWFLTEVSKVQQGEGACAIPMFVASWSLWVTIGKNKERQRGRLGPTSTNAVSLPHH
jgi:hypothetical protein